MTRRPSAAEEARFWELVESAWERVGAEANERRLAVARGDDDDPGAVRAYLDSFLGHLRELSADLSADELTDLDRVVERKLYDIDRSEIQEVTDGSDEGFLYCRGFVVALGKEFYDAVNADPARAFEDAECPDICYFFAKLHEEKVGDWPATNSGISRESTRNKAGWA